jgi:pimeloyl-ACP methyl ester carboxylesterase
VHARGLIVIAADYRGRVKELMMPTLLVVGKDDSFTGEDSRNMLRALPDGKLAVLPGGHLCHLIHPEKFLAAVYNFLGKGRLPKYKAV